MRPQLEGLEDRTLLSVTSFLVNVTGDSGGASGTGSYVTTASGTVGEGNLRWCINQADLPANNGASITFDQTVFTPSKTTTIGLSNGELPISDSMTITNAGGPATIKISGTDGKTGGSRVFDIIPSTATVAITGLTITAGNANVYYTSLAGNQGGDIFNGGALTLNDDVVSNGLSIGTVGGPAGRGGGIFNAEGQSGAPGATLTLNNTIVENNTAQGVNGQGEGGGIYNDINATVIVQNQPQFTQQNTQIINNQALGNNSLGRGLGGGIANVGALQIIGTPSTHIAFTDNLAQGGTETFGLVGGDAYGGGVFNAGSMTLQFVTFLGNQAQGGAGGLGGGDGEPDVGDQGSEIGGAGGNAQGGGIYNAGSSALSLPNVVFGVDAKGVGNEAVGGVGGAGENGDNRGENGGDAGAGGFARGGAVASTSGGLVFKSTTFTSSEAIGGDGGAGGFGYPGFLPTSGTGTAGGHGGAGGNAGDAYGGAVFNSSGTLNFSTDSFVANKAQGGKGGTGGNGNGGDTGAAGLTAVAGQGGFGGAGGIGGGAQGGGFYNINAALTIGTTTFTANAVGAGNDAIGGNGGDGGIGGNGGQGGDSGGQAGLGAAGGFGGKGGDTRRASGGAGADVNGAAVISATTITSSLVQVGNGGAGGAGGRGGNSGNNTLSPPDLFLDGLYGGAGGDGGAGGNAGPGLGGALAISSSTLTLSGNTFGGSTAALADQVIGGAGGNGGTGGNIGSHGHITAQSGTVYVVAYDTNPPTSPPGPPEGQVNPAGNGGAGGAGSTVSGGAVSVTSAAETGIDVLSRYQGLNFSQSGPYQGINYLTPNAQGAAGPNSFVEAINQSIALFTAKTTSSPVQTDSLPHFFGTVGNLTHPIFGQYIDPAVVWDDQIQRFIVVDMDVDGSFNNPIVTQHQSFLDIAVSNSASPATLTAADWSFYQIATTETANGASFDPQDTGNIGYNADGLVVTLNMYNSSAVENHVQVNAISNSALTTPGATLTLGTNAFQLDYAGANLRPTVMHSSKTGDPMWFVQQGSSGNNSTINVVELTNPFTTTAAFTTFNGLGVNPYAPAVPMLQPVGGPITGVNSEIQKVAENTIGGQTYLVAAQTVSDVAGDEDNVQWYVINVTGGTPAMQQQGDVSGGPGVYDAFPSIDINSQGEIGMTFAQSGRAGPYLSMDVTGATADTNGVYTMRTPVVTQSGLQNYHGDLLGTKNPIGPVSGIGVDPTDGSFWAVNQFADLETFTNWGTAIAHFTIPASTVPVQTVSIDHTTFTTIAIVTGAGGNGGSAGIGSDDGRNHGINGQGGQGGFAQGGTIFLSSPAAQGASLNNVTIASSSATAGAGGAGAINTLGADNVSFYYRQAYGLNGNPFGWNGFGSSGGNGGSVKGVGLAAVNYSLNLAPPNGVTGTDSFTGGIGIAGSGGNGGGAGGSLPRSWAGGAGGNGGSVQGGAVFLSNNVASTTPLSFTFNGGVASNYTLTAGVAGSGGNAGASTTAGKKSNVAGGVGGVGGNAQGGGIYVFAGSKSINTVSFNDLSVLGDQIAAGGGGQGGAGYVGNGGQGGSAEGGGVFNTSLNGASGQNGSLTITNSTLAGDDATGGNGGNAGSATTPNGGQGGTGGNAGDADGGGLFNGDGMPMTVLNSTFGGGSVNGSSANANILTSGLGGRGGNAGTPAGVVRNNGGAGGNGGSVAGGNVYNSSTSTFFYNDTVVQGQASIFGLGGVGGSGAGNGGLTGAPGAVGTGVAGGYFAAPPLPTPATPKLVAGASGGSWTAQTAWVLITYVNANGETTGSAAASAAVAANGTLTIDSPAAQGTGNGAATGWYAYVGVGTTQPANTALFRQQAAGSPTPIGTNLVLAANPTTTGANPPTSNTSANNTLGNTILAFNSAAAKANPDASGTFISKGGNILSSAVAGFNTGSGGNDQIVTTSYAANLGPLLNNGGPTPTNAVLPGSPAVTSGITTLITAPPFSPNPNDNNQIDDQRGTGFARTFQNTVSSGAFEFLPPVINSLTSTPPGLNPSSVVEGSAGISLTVSGTNFATGATVTFGAKVLTPISSSSTKLVVAVPAALLTTPGTVPVYVNIPDGSGIAGQTESSTPVNFTILSTPFTLNNPGNQQGYVGGQVNLQITPAAGFSGTGFTDVVNNLDTLPPGLTIDPTTGKISGTITGNAGSPYTVTISATDNNGDSASVTFTWTVSGPLVLNSVPPQTNNEGDTVHLQISAPPGYTPSGFTDVVNGQHTLPPGLSINTSTGLITGTIDPRGAGPYTVTITPTNNNGKGYVIFNWTVNDSTPPSLTNPGTQTSAAGTDVNLQIQAQDADKGSWTAQGLPPGLLIDANGEIFGTIAGNAQGVYAVSVQAADGTVPSAVVSFFWFVSASTSSPASPQPSPPGAIPAGTQGLATSTSIVNVTNQYQGFVQLETVTVDVTSSSGFTVNEGIVAISVNGQTSFAPVHNGVATASFVTGLFDLSLWPDLVYSHPLSASFSDSAGTFASSDAGTTLPAIWIDFLLTMLALDIGRVNQV